MSQKRVRRHARKKHTRRSALTVAALATATATTFAPITPTPEAEAATTYISTIMIEVFNAVGGIFGISYPFPSVPPNAADIRSVMSAGGNLTGVIGIMDGALAAGQAVNLLNSNHASGGTYQFALARNPGRANGGFASRFDWLYSILFGTSAVSGNGINVGGYNSQVYDWGGGYDWFSDFPITPNPVSIANSLAQAFFPVNLLGAPIGPTTFVTQGPNNGTPVQYLTIVPTFNALLYPLRLPQLIAPIIGLPSIDLPIIGDPFAALTTFANAYEKPLDILINIGYSDVITAEGATQWERTFQQFTTNKQFLSEFLTIDQYVEAVGDAATIAFNNTVPMVEAVIVNTLTFAQQAITAIVNFIQSIIGNITGVSVSPAIAAATLPIELVTTTTTAATPRVEPTETLPSNPTSRHGSDSSVQQAEAEQLSSEEVAPAPAPEDVPLAELVIDEIPPAELVIDEVQSAEPTAGELADAELAADDPAAPDETLTDAGEGAEEKLDAAAEQARARANDAASGAQGQVNTVNGQVTGTVEQASAPTTGDAPSGAAASASRGDGAPSTGDAAA